MQSWLDVLTYSTRELEPPERYFWWSGLSAISAIVRRNVWLDKFTYKLYPNIYTILVSAKSGLRKGLPLSYAQEIVEIVGGTRVISGTNSIEGVIQHLSQQVTTERGEVFSDAQALLLAPEMSSFLVENDRSLTILTDMYDTNFHIDWKKMLKGGPIESLKNLSLTLLAASNEVLFDTVVKGKDIEGGFIARSFIIHESKRRNKNSLMKKPEGLISKKDLAEALRPLKDLKGEFKISDEVRTLYDKWYQGLPEDYEDRTGTMERIGDKVLKAAMLVSLAREPVLEISREALEEAIDKTEECMSGVKKISMTGTSILSPAIAKVLKLLLTQPGYEISRKKLLQKVWPDITSIDLDSVVDNLQQSGAIKMPERRGNEWFYILEKGIAEQYEKFKEKQA